jgi:hypothetical protein
MTIITCLNLPKLWLWPTGSLSTTLHRLTLPTSLVWHSRHSTAKASQIFQPMFFLPHKSEWVHIPMYSCALLQHTASLPFFLLVNAQIWVFLIQLKAFSSTDMDLILWNINLSLFWSFILPLSTLIIIWVCAYFYFYLLFRTRAIS